MRNLLKNPFRIRSGIPYRIPLEFFPGIPLEIAPMIPLRSFSRNSFRNTYVPSEILAGIAILAEISQASPDGISTIISLESPP